MTLAIFDLDHTLLDGDSDYLWGRYLARRGIVDGASYERDNRRFYAQYRRGALDMTAYLAFSLAPLAAHRLEQLHAWRADFLHTVIRPLITPAARALVEKHRGAGDTLLVITATNRFVTQPIVAEFGIPHLLATELEQNARGYTGRGRGVPCFREGKVVRLNAWLADTGETLAGACFYSDSHNDLPLLEKVARPVAVDPDETLRRHAAGRGWPVISLRDATRRADEREKERERGNDMD